MQTVALAALVLGSTVLYLRKVGEGSFREGFLVGLSWVVVMIALDLVHSVVMPIITTLTMGYLERRSLEPKS
jgi:hypothetical protein